jgi:glycine/D-amino acid oxidase-like deaminating enzyme
MNSEHYDVVVTGGGQAGPAIGYHLAARGSRFTNLDAGATPAAARESRWDSLKLSSLLPDTTPSRGARSRRARPLPRRATRPSRTSPASFRVLGQGWRWSCVIVATGDRGVWGNRRGGLRAAAAWVGRLIRRRRAAGFRVRREERLRGRAAS